MKRFIWFICLIYCTYAKEEELPTLDDLLADPSLLKIIEKRLDTLLDDKEPASKPEDGDGCNAASVTFNENCSFHTNTSVIIKATESRAKGATFILNTPDVECARDCTKLCCDTEGCDTAVYQNKGKHNCYLFECGLPSKCEFVAHDEYMVSLKDTHGSHISTQGAATETHENELDQLGKSSPPAQNNASLGKPTTERPPQAQKPAGLDEYCEKWGIECEDVHAECVHNKCQCLFGYQVKDGTCREVCDERQFECVNEDFRTGLTNCVPLSYTCDGTQDCADGSDERNCGPPPNGGYKTPAQTGNYGNQAYQQYDKGQYPYGYPLPGLPYQPGPGPLQPANQLYPGQAAANGNVGGQTYFMPGLTNGNAANVNQPQSGTLMNNGWPFLDNKNVPNTVYQNSVPYQQQPAINQPGYVAPGVAGQVLPQAAQPGPAVNPAGRPVAAVVPVADTHPQSQQPAAQPAPPAQGYHPGKLLPGSDATVYSLTQPPSRAGQAVEQTTHPLHIHVAQETHHDQGEMNRVMTGEGQSPGHQEKQQQSLPAHTHISDEDRLPDVGSGLGDQFNHVSSDRFPDDSSDQFNQVPSDRQNYPGDSSDRQNYPGDSSDRQKYPGVENKARQQASKVESATGSDTSQGGTGSHHRYGVGREGGDGYRLETIARHRGNTDMKDSSSQGQSASGYERGEYRPPGSVEGGSGRTYPPQTKTNSQVQSPSHPTTNAPRVKPGHSTSHSESLQDFSSWTHYDKDTPSTSAKKGPARNQQKQPPVSGSQSSKPRYRTGDQRQHKTKPSSGSSDELYDISDYRKPENHMSQSPYLKTDNYYRGRYRGDRLRRPDGQGRGSKYPYYDNQGYRGRDRNPYLDWEDYRDDYLYPDEFSDGRKFVPSNTVDYGDYRSENREDNGKQSDGKPPAKVPSRPQTKPKEPEHKVPDVGQNKPPKKTGTASSRDDMDKDWTDRDEDTDWIPSAKTEPKDTEKQTPNVDMSPGPADEKPAGKDGSGNQAGSEEPQAKEESSKSQDTDSSDSSSGQNPTSTPPSESLPTKPTNQSQPSPDSEPRKSEGFLEETEIQVTSYTDMSQGPIVALALGLAITLILLIFVGCRLRTVKRKIRKGRALHSNEADYLINGMYL